jgi:hypothetical protein
MGVVEARGDLLTNYKNLKVVQNKDGNTWRVTLAHTPWVMLRWGYEESGLKFELHVHGKVHGKGYKLAADPDAKVAGAGLNVGQCFLDSTQRALVRPTVKQLLG